MSHVCCSCRLPRPPRRDPHRDELTVVGVARDVELHALARLEARGRALARLPRHGGNAINHF